MKGGIIMGMALGMVAGAYIVNNNRKAKQLVDKAQSKIMDKVDDIAQSIEQRSMEHSLS